MNQFVEHINVSSVLWQLTDENIGKAAHVRIETVDGNQITTFLGNGVHFSLCFEDDGRITLTGWAKQEGKPSFEFAIVDEHGAAISNPLLQQKG